MDLSHNSCWKTVVPISLHSHELAVIEIGSMFCQQENLDGIKLSLGIILVSIIYPTWPDRTPKLKVINAIKYQNITPFDDNT
jgi:hypothetical protein